MDFYEQVRKSMAWGSPVGAVGLERDKAPIMETSRGRVLRYHAVMYVLAGRGFFQDESVSRRTVTPGTVFFLYPGRWHWFDPDPGTVWTEYWVLFDGADAERRFGRLLPPPERPIHNIGRDEAIVEAYEQLHGIWAYGCRGYAQRSLFLLHRILAGFFMAIEKIGAPHGDRLIRLVRETVARNMHVSDVDFRRLAEAEGMSYERFRKLFKALSGAAPKQYHLAARLNRARELLLNSDRSVKEIASAVGFSDALYFSRLFKSRLGVSPKRYRAEHMDAAEES